MKILLDLDGTLIDSRERLYKLFSYLVPQSSISFSEYWNLKRSGMGHREILQKFFLYSEEEILLFEGEWFQKIELPIWLALDKPFDGVTDHLACLSERNELYLITARQHEEITLNQISSFGWVGLFHKILITKQKVEKDVLIRSQLQTDETDWIVGDTGADIQTGKRLGIRTAAVLSGFLSKESLQNYRPDLLINNVLEFKTRI